MKNNQYKSRITYSEIVTTYSNPHHEVRMVQAMPATPEEIDDAFWGACHGGSRATAEYLLDRGAQLDRVAWDDLTPLAAAERNGATDLVEWLRSRQGR